MTVNLSEGIEAWVTSLAGEYICHLDRSEESPFRAFFFRREGRPVGGGSLEFRRFGAGGAPNALLAAHPGLLSPLDTATSPNLVWMSFRGKTTTWIVEETEDNLDDSEEPGLWTKVSGRGIKQILGDRQIWPDGYWTPGSSVWPTPPTVNEDESTWMWPNWTIPVGPGTLTALYGMAGLAMEMIVQSNDRYPTKILPWTLDDSDALSLWSRVYRFDNVLEAIADIEAQFGVFTVDPVQVGFYPDPTAWQMCLNYRAEANWGHDRSATVILEEGTDLRSLDHAQSGRDAVSFVVAEGDAPEDTEVPLLSHSTDDTVIRRREGYTKASGVTGATTLAGIALATRLANAPADSLEFEIAEGQHGGEHFFAITDFDRGDLVRIISPRLGVDAVVQIMALTFTEGEDDLVTPTIEIGPPPPDQLVKVSDAGKATSSQLTALVRANNLPTFGDTLPDPTVYGSNRPFFYTKAGVDGEWCHYDGTRWVGSTLYHDVIATNYALNPITGTGTVDLVGGAIWPGDSTDILIKDFHWSGYFSGAHSAANHWTMNLRKVAGSTFTTIASPQTTFVPGAGAYGDKVAVNALLGQASGYVQWSVNCVATGSPPGNSYLNFAVTYRKVYG
jgi:hypothetical protein